MVIFPNLVINDVMAITVRTFWPTAPDYMEVNAWALAPVEESEWLRKFRLFNFTEFLGPGGFATPDRSEERTSELQSLMRISYAVFCLKKKNLTTQQNYYIHI